MVRIFIFSGAKYRFGFELAPKDNTFNISPDMVFEEAKKLLKIK